jgi:hypothetical protein
MLAGKTNNCNSQDNYMATDNMKQFMNEFKEHYENNYQQQILELWIEIAKEHGVAYEIKDGQAVPKDPQLAKEKHFGSGTKGVRPDFWFDKATAEFQKRLKEIE